jgi:hypothetical protein
MKAGRISVVSQFHAVEDAFGSAVDYAMLVKIYGSDATDDSRHDPAEVSECKPSRCK